jgi:methyl-accepting chemotaxis protein
MPHLSTNRRRTRLVLRDLQGQILLQTTALPLAVLAGLLAAFAVLGRRILDEAATALAEIPALESLLIGVMCLGAAMVGAILFVAYRFSHRIAGPAYRIIKSLERVGEGDVDFQVTLRKGDLLTEVADQFNATLKALQSRRTGGPQPVLPTAASATEHSAATAAATADVPSA